MTAYLLPRLVELAAKQVAVDGFDDEILPPGTSRIWRFDGYC
jgi:hypothetical protein